MLDSSMRMHRTVSQRTFMSASGRCWQFMSCSIHLSGSYGMVVVGDVVGSGAERVPFVGIYPTRHQTRRRHHSACSCDGVCSRYPYSPSVHGPSMNPKSASSTGTRSWLGFLSTPHTSPNPSFATTPYSLRPATTCWRPSTLLMEA